MLRVVGYLVTLLALARFFAPVPSDAPVDSAAPAPAEAPAQTDDADEPILRKVVFLPGVTDGNRAPADLRNPFKARMVKTAAGPGAPPNGRSGSKTRVRHDLRDPFATKPSKQQLKPAPDLRDPFVRPQRALPKCPDTGGVPIQRPDSIDPGCATASLRVILAHR